MAWYNGTDGDLIAPSGGDYTNLADFEAAYDGEDLTGTDGVLARLQGTDGSSGTVYWSGWQAGQSASCKIVVRADTGYETEGKDGDGSANARITKLLRFSEGTNALYVDISGIEFTGNLSVELVDNTFKGGVVSVAKCLFRDSSDSYGKAFFIGRTTGAFTLNVGSCVIKDYTGSYGVGIYDPYGDSDLTVNVFNCTVIRCKFGGLYFGANTTATVKNCAVESATGTDLTNVDTSTTNLTAGSVSIADGTDFTDPTSGNDDFHVADTDSALYGAGTAISDSWFTSLCSTDFDGTAWASPPSVGAYEYVSEGGGGAVTKAGAMTPAGALTRHASMFRSPTGAL